MANMTFKANLLPNSDLGYSLGSTTQQWMIYGDLTGTATLLKPISNTTSYSPSTWNIPAGSVQVWGERFSDSTLSYTPAGGDPTTITDTGDWTMWLTPSTTSNAATLNMRIDGTYYASGGFNGNLTGNASSATKATQDGSGNVITSTYVKKAGDTMTGNLTINKTTNPALYLKNTDMDTHTTATLAEAEYSTIYFIDNNSSNNLSAYIQNQQNTSGDSILTVSARRRKADDSANVNNAITLTSKSDGTLAVSVSTPAGWRSAIGAVNKAGDTMTGNLLGSKINTLGNTTIGNHWYKLYIGGATTSSNAINSANPLIEFSNTDRSQYGQLVYTDYDSVRAPDGLTWVGNQANSWFQAPRVFGAVWNDYAEYRETKEDIQPGRCVVETGKGDLILSTERLQGGCEIVSDTFGFAIGETKTCKTPTACTGRVLAYLYEDNNLAKPGEPVCSGPDGTVSLMTHEEEKEWPSRIIGTISEIPNYEEWEYGSADINGNKNKLKVDGRVWIRIR